MTIVKSPYNFVPAPTENQVFKPDWAGQVSHDIPFEDGESGEVEIELTAETPIFIRNGQKKDEKTEEFSHYIGKNGQKQFFIPATSVKGMVRNVLEIMSFSRLNKNLINDHRYAFRDLSSATNQYMTRYKNEKIRAGWLVQDKEGNWTIEGCDDFAFIEHQELKEQFNIPFRDYYFNKQPKDKSALSKYEDRKVKEAGLIHTFSKYTKPISKNSTLSLPMAKYHPRGLTGALVFTGQPGKRTETEGRRASGKTREFVFFESPTPTIINVPEDHQKDFKFIYGDADPNNLSPDWKYWRDKLIKGDKVPVFFSVNSNGDLQHFGLSYMYKLPFKYKISELNPIKSYGHQRDLAETVFGYAEKNDALKGRVMFSHAWSDPATAKELSPVSEILAGPKASYFPFYLSQFQGNGKYFTYDDPNATLRGYKRYPIKDEILRPEYDQKQLENSKVFSRFKPLKEGCKFRFKVRFHNLLPAEIGALLSAISFHGYSDTFYHNLGAGKPLGYGKIKASILSSRYLKNDLMEYMLDYERMMIETNPSWLSSPQLQELFSMARGGEDNEYLSYPSVTDYVDYKKTQVNRQEKELDHLDSFSEFFELEEISKTIKPLAVRMRTQDILELDRFDNYQDLSKFLNEELSVFGEFTDSNKELIFNKIIEIVKSGHKDSIKKLRKESHWLGNISNWLGEIMMKNLKSKLSGLIN